MGWGSKPTLKIEPGIPMVEPRPKPIDPNRHTPKSVVTALESDNKPSFDMVVAVFRTYLKELADARIPIRASEEQQREFETKVTDAKQRTEFMLNELGLGQYIDFEG